MCANLINTIIMVTSVRFEFAVVMWFHCWVLLTGNRCVNKNNIELYDRKNNSIYHCWPTPKCHEGQQSTMEPGSVHPYRKDIDVSCKPCGHGLFSNNDTNYRCTKCKTCGKMEISSDCTVSTDTVCSTSLCRSKRFYFNKTDGQCHLCSECCGNDGTNIEPECLVAFSHVGSVTGQRGALHCKEFSFQRCDESLTSTVSSNVNNVSVVNCSNALENTCNCSEPVNKVTVSYTDSNIYTSKLNQKCRSLDSLHILLICFCILVTFACICLLCLCTRERKLRLSLRNGCSSRSCTPLICTARSADQGRGHVSELQERLNAGISVGVRREAMYTSLASTDQGRGHVSEFQERLNAGIPAGLRIDSIGDEVQGYIEKLDLKMPGVNYWYHVGRKLGFSNDVLHSIKRYDTPGESPTHALVSILRTQEEVITLRAFVQVLHAVGRDDICNLIFNYYCASGQRDTPV